MTWDEYEVVRLDFPFTESVEGDAQLCFALVLLDAPDKRAKIKHDQLFSAVSHPFLYGIRILCRKSQYPQDIRYRNGSHKVL